MWAHLVPHGDVVAQTRSRMHGTFLSATEALKNKGHSRLDRRARECDSRACTICFALRGSIPRRARAGPLLREVEEARHSDDDPDSDVEAYRRRIRITRLRVVSELAAATD